MNPEEQIGQLVGIDLVRAYQSLIVEIKDQINIQRNKYNPTGSDISRLRVV